MPPSSPWTRSRQPRRRQRWQHRPPRRLLDRSPENLITEPRKQARRDFVSPSRPEPVRLARKRGDCTRRSSGFWRSSPLRAPRCPITADAPQHRETAGIPPSYWDPRRFPERADDGIRTRDTWLGKPVLYQLSYVRVPRRPILPPRKKRPLAASLTLMEGLARTDSRRNRPVGPRWPQPGSLSSPGPLPEYSG